ncbi:MAG: DUF192 domain-containing protein [Anaerolineae bacterium]|jgi:hypothetical protein|nr:DUF192 domain-containing protein [Anaerolineae bacterium]
MSEWRKLVNAKTGAVILPRLRLCISWWCHFKGLQFSSQIAPDQGLLFVTRSEGRVHTAIHMFFVFYPIAVFWLDRHCQVVDKKLAKPWRPSYAPSKPAQYYLETHVDLLDHIQVGDLLNFEQDMTS